MRNSASIRLSLFAILGLLGLSGCGASTPATPEALAGGPSLLSTSPKDGEKDVPPARPFFLEFSEPMDPTSLKMTLNPAQVLDTPAWTEGSLVALIRPVTPMAAATSYEVTIKGNSATGAALSAAFSFATSIDTAEAPPELVGVTPGNGATGVGLNASISLRFSKPMDTASVQVVLSPDIPLDDAVWSLGNQVMILANPNGYAQNTRYTVTVAGQDLDARPLGGVLSSTFTTTNVPDTTRPTVVLSTPSSGAQNVSLTSTISVLFSEGMRAVAGQAAFSAQPAIACAYSWDQERLLLCKPTAPLTANTNYQVTIGTGAVDSANNALAAPFAFSFRTAAGADVSPPAVSAISPANSSTGRSLREPVVIAFSEPMALGTTQTAFSITSPTGFTGSFQWNAGTNQFTFTPSKSFAFLTPVTWQVSTAATDASGNRLATAATGTFQIRNCTLQSDVLAKYNGLGGAGSFLGRCTTDEVSVLNGAARFNDFQGGSIYFSAATGAHEVHGPIRSRWAALGLERSAIGLPTTDQTNVPDGSGFFNHFQVGSIYYSPGTGAHEVRGDIHKKWAQLGYERGIGYPLTDELTTADGVGRYNHFQAGSIFWKPNLGAHETHGDIHKKWAQLGHERSVVGYPTTDETRTPDGVGRYNHFERGSIYWTPGTGAHEVHGAIRDEWARRGYERSALGYPTSDEFPIPNGFASDFQRGSIRFFPATGYQVVFF